MPAQTKTTSADCEEMVALSEASRLAAAQCRHLLSEHAEIQEFLQGTHRRHPTIHPFNALEMAIRHFRGQVPAAAHRAWQEASAGWWKMALLVKKQIKRISWKIGWRQEQREDLFQDAWFTVVNAARSWDPKKDGASFAAYVGASLRSDLRTLRDQDNTVRLSSSDALLRVQLLALKAQHPGLTESALAQKAEVSIEKMRFLLSWSHFCDPLHAPSGPHGEGRVLEERLAACTEEREEPPTDIALRRWQRTCVRYALARLPHPRQQVVVMLSKGLVDGQERKPAEISALLGMSIWWVRHVEKTAHRNLEALLVRLPKKLGPLQPLPGLEILLSELLCAWPHCRQETSLVGLCNRHEGTVAGTLTRIGRPPRLAHRERAAAALHRWWPAASERLQPHLAPATALPDPRPPRRLCAVPSCSSPLHSYGLCRRHSAAAGDFLADVDDVPYYYASDRYDLLRLTGEALDQVGQRWPLLARAIDDYRVKLDDESDPVALLALPRPGEAAPLGRGDSQAAERLREGTRRLHRMVCDHWRRDDVLDAAITFFFPGEGRPRKAPTRQEALEQLQRDNDLFSALESGLQERAEQMLERWVDAFLPGEPGPTSTGSPLGSDYSPSAMILPSGAPIRPHFRPGS